MEFTDALGMFLSMHAAGWHHSGATPLQWALAALATISKGK